MRKSIFEIQYFETYYFANIIKNILEDSFNYLRVLNGFFGEDNYKGFVQPFQKNKKIRKLLKVLKSLDRKKLE